MHVDEGVSRVHLRKQGAGKLPPVLEVALPRSRKHRRLDGMHALVGKQQPQICVNAVVGRQPQRLHLAGAKGYIALGKLSLRRLKGQFLFQGAHVFKAVPVRFLDHAADGRIRGRHGRIALPDEHALRAQPLAGDVVGALRPLLDVHGHDAPALDVQRLVAQKHRHIGLDGVPCHVADLQSDTVRVVQAEHRPIVRHADVQFSTIAVCEGDDLLFDLVRHFGLQFHHLALLKAHAPTSRIIPPTFYPHSNHSNHSCQAWLECGQ